MKKRVISIIIMAIIAIPLLVMGGYYFSFLMMLLSVLSLREIINLRKKEIPFAIKSFAYMSLIFFVYNQSMADILKYAIDYRVVTIPLILLLLPLTVYYEEDKYNINDALYLLGFIFLIGASFSLISLIRDYNIMYIIYLLIIGITSDTYAYLFGTLIGRRKLSKVSPKKTVEGTVLGIAFGGLFGTLFYTMVINSTMDIVMISLITLLFAIIGQLGDLCFSAIKRKYNKKDYSNLIPGHGGILDRLDSFIFIILIFSLFINII